jgi:adenylate cyclase
MSQDVKDRVADTIRCRQVDIIAVKGKTKGVSVFTARTMLTPQEDKAWAIHDEAVGKYYSRDFGAAAQGFREVLALLPEDYPASIYLERSKAFASAAPPEGWDGVEVLTEK